VRGDVDAELARDGSVYAANPSDVDYRQVLVAESERPYKVVLNTAMLPIARCERK
jgi:hypothetical protein